VRVFTAYASEVLLEGLNEMAKVGMGRTGARVAWVRIALLPSACLLPLASFQSRLLDGTMSKD
jgi:hypothetical protein